MAIGRGTAKQLRVKRQAGKGVRATGGTGGMIVRRNTSNFELAKEMTTTEAEQTSSRQVMSANYGPRVVNGSYSGIFSPGTQADMLSALLMRDFTAKADIVGLTLTIAGTGPLFTVTRSAGSWLADGVKIGRVIRIPNVVAINGNRNRNLAVVGVTALALTVMPVNWSQTKKLMVAEAAVAGATVTFPGGVTWVPQSGHTNVYYTVEEWFSDQLRSKVTDDVKFTTATIRMPGSGNCGIDFGANGLNQVRDPGGAATPYFSAPAPETTTKALVASGGVLFVNGVATSVVTDATCTLDGRGAVADPVVGNVQRPDVFTGKLVASGSFTAYDDSADADLASAFENETDISVFQVLSAGSADNADFVSLMFGQVKVSSATADDPEVGRKLTCAWSAQYDTTGGAGTARENTTVEVQDSAVVPS